MVAYWFLHHLWKWYVTDSCISCGNGMLQIPASAVEMPGHMMPQLDVQFGVDFGSDSNQFGFGSSGDTNSSYTSSSPPTKSVSSYSSSSYSCSFLPHPQNQSFPTLCSSSVRPATTHFFPTHKVCLPLLIFCLSNSYLSWPDPRFLAPSSVNLRSWSPPTLFSLFILSSVLYTSTHQSWYDSTSQASVASKYLDSWMLSAKSWFQSWFKSTTFVHPASSELLNSLSVNFVCCSLSRWECCEKIWLLLSMSQGWIHKNDCCIHSCLSGSFANNRRLP